MVTLVRQAMLDLQEIEIGQDITPERGNILEPHDILVHIARLRKKGEIFHKLDEFQRRYPHLFQRARDMAGMLPYSHQEYFQYGRGKRPNPAIVIKKEERKEIFQHKKIKKRYLNRRKDANDYLSSHTRTRPKKRDTATN